MSWFSGLHLYAVFPSIAYAQLLPDYVQRSYYSHVLNKRGVLIISVVGKYYKI